MKECPNCGGKLTFSPDNRIATCFFCESKHLVPGEAKEFGHLCDFPDAVFQVRHLEPVLSAEDAKAILIKAAADDPLASKELPSYPMELHCHYVPIWVIETKIHATWSGKFSQTRTVTKFRSVSKTRRVGDSTETYTEQEPYDSEEIYWTAANGTIHFGKNVWNPANEAFDQSILGFFSTFASDAEKTKPDLPRLEAGWDFIPAECTQRKALPNLEESMNRWAEARCADKVEKLEHVTASLAGITFALTYCPVCTIEYEVNEARHIHQVELISGQHSGDIIPLDEAAASGDSIVAAAKEAESAQAGIDQQRRQAEQAVAALEKRAKADLRKWKWAGVALGMIWIFWPTGHVSRAILAITAAELIWYFILKHRMRKTREAAAAQIMGAVPQAAPWNDFVATNRVALLRLARLACNTRNEDNTLKTFGVLEDVASWAARRERFDRLKALEADSEQSRSTADQIARFCVAGNSPCADEVPEDAWNTAALPSQPV